MHNKSKKELKFKRTRKPNGAAVTALAYCNGPDVLIAGECYCTTQIVLLHMVVVDINANTTLWCSLMPHNTMLLVIASQQVIHVMDCAECGACR